MADTLNTHRRIFALALVGLALIVTGLWLAALSNPIRFSLNVADDRSIQLFAISGFACTLAGVGLFLYAIRRTTTSMPAQLRTNANIGVGLGFVLQLAGLFAPEIWPISVELGWALVLAGLPAFIWGGMHYAQGKGYSKSFGLLAILGILGLVVLILLPGQESKAMPNAGT
jgi:hypothetical protein